MSLSFKTHHLKRYKDIAMLLLTYGSADMVQNVGLRSTLTEDDLNAAKQSDSPDQLADDLEKMGPTFVKLGQILSSRSDLIPPRYLKGLTRLQDKVKPFSYEEVEEAVVHGLGVRLSKGFKSFDREPMAAASLGQVHKAVLRDGRNVVVKIQRPNIRKQIAEDLEVLENLAEFLSEHTDFGRRFQVHKIFEEFQHTLIHELDYTMEASNLKQIHENLREFPNIVVPLPVNDYSTSTILTMDFVPGKKITDVQPFERIELPGSALADEVLKAYLKQVLVDGIFHADPHPGNVLLTPDHKVALIDLGMVGRTSPEMQERLLKLLIAISEGHGDDVASLAIKMSETTDHFEEAQFRREIATVVSEQQNATLAKLDIGKVLLDVCRIAGMNGLYVPVELSLLGKTLLQLDEVGRALDEQFNPNAAVRRHVREILNQKLQKDATSGKLLNTFLEMKDFVGGLPNRINKLMDLVGNNNVEVKVRATDVHLVLEGFQKIANRITTGLILAALIIGASLLMRVQSSFQLFGYPGLAILCFIAAAGGGFWLVFSIMMADHKTRRKQR
jgi:ubiquinone biosynthesis protein